MMSHQPPLSQAQKERMEKARQLITDGRYQEAIETLQAVDHPLARQWLGKLREKLGKPNPGAQASEDELSAKPKHTLPIYSPNALQTLPTCPSCGRELDATLANCTHHQTKQCPYRVEKQESGPIWFFALGILWLTATLVPFVDNLLNQRLTLQDESDVFFFFIGTILPLALTVYGALAFLNGRKLSLTSQHGEWVYTQTLFGKKTEIHYPLMYVEAPHSSVESDLPVSVLMSYLRDLKNAHKSERVFSSYSNGSVIYLALVGLMLRGAIRLYVRYSLRISGSAQKKHEQLNFYFAAVPSVYTPRGTLEDNLFAVLPMVHPPSAAYDLKTIIKNTAQRAHCDIYKLVQRTVEKDIKALGLNKRLGAVSIALRGLGIVFGGEPLENAREIAGEFLPKRPAALTQEELDDQIQALADAYDAFEASQSGVLKALYGQIDDIIESSRPDVASGDY